MIYIHITAMEDKFGLYIYIKARRTSPIHTHIYIKA